MVARGLAALALVAVLALIVITLQQKPPVEPTATPDELAKIRALGGGVTMLMIEEFHRSARARYHFTLDTSQSVESLQALTDDLRLPFQIRDIVGNKRLLAFVSTGGAVPRGMADEIGRRYGSRARDLFEVSCLLDWVSLQGMVVPQYFGEMEEQLMDAYRASYPAAARRINLLAVRLGASSRLDPDRSGDPNDVTERCWEIGEELDGAVKNSG